MAAYNCVRSEHNFIQDFADLYHSQLIENTNPTVMKWPLVGTDRLIFFIVGCYVLFVNIIGPNFMRNRKPFDLRWLMVPYNAVLVVFNLYIFIEFAKIRWLSGTEATTCSTLKITDNPQTYRLAEVTWLFYISKYFELSDTIFFVLRKKERQLSRLHLVHHSTVPIIIWGMLRAEPGGYNTFFPLANSFVHVVMYTYYGISALGDDVTIHLRFKKYITMTQMVQFILVLYHMLSRPFYGCHVTPLFLFFNVFIAGFFFVLFANFYWNEYILMREERLKEAARKKEQRNGKLKEQQNGKLNEQNGKLKAK